MTGNIENKKRLAVIEKRDITIDIVKGIGIIMMVLGHSGFGYSSYFKTFHMPLFFIVSGCLYNNEASGSIGSVKSYILKKLKTLWLPYAAANSIFILLNNIFIGINVYTTNPLIEGIGGLNIGVTSDKMGILDMFIGIVKSFFFGGGTTIGGPLWFLRALFAGLVMTCVIEFVLRKIFKGLKDASKIVFCIQVALGIIFLVAGYVFTKNSISVWKLPQFLTAYFFIMLGRVIRKTNILWKINRFKEERGKKARAFMYVAVIAVLAVILFGLEKVVKVNLADNFYTGLAGMVAASVTGFFFTYFVADLLKNTFLAKGLVKCGQNTLAIMILHCLCFKAVTLAQVVSYHYENYKIAAFPILENSGLWWLAYAVCGIIIPILLNDIRKYLILHYH